MTKKNRLLCILVVVYIVALGVSCISLVLSYSPSFYSSSAWLADFGWAIPESKFPAIPEDQRNIGWLWEGLRTLLFAVGSVVVYRLGVPESAMEFLGLDHTAKNRLTWLWLCRGITLALFVFAVVFVLMHHLSWGPNELAQGGKLWGKWETEYAVAPKEPIDVGYREMYVRPYLAYLPYSAVNFLVFGVPFVGVFLYAAGAEIYRADGWRRSLKRKLKHTTSCDELRLTFAEGCADRSTAIERHCYAAVGLACIVVFEYNLGQYTLSEPALYWAWASYGLAAIGLLVLCGHIGIYQRIAQRAHMEAIRLKCPEKPYVENKGLYGFYNHILRGNWAFYVASVLLLTTPVGIPIKHLIQVASHLPA